MNNLSLIFLLAFLWNTLGYDKLINSKATIQAQQLYDQLIENNGKYVFSGQTTFNYDDFISKTGQKPIIQGFDMQNYSPHNPWFNWQPMDDGTVEKAIKWFKSTNKKGIVTFFWHWFSPNGGKLRTSTFYTNNTDFDVSKAVIKNTVEYNETLRDIDAIGYQLKKLNSENIPILWRPLHEAGGKWFWWGAKSNTDCLALYQIMYDRLTSHHQLNNLIWVWSTPESQWYPSNQKVDIIGYDSYPGNFNYDCLIDRYNQLRVLSRGQKMLMITQNGPIPQFNYCLQQNIKWGLFMGWNTLVFEQNSMDHIQQIYKSSSIIKL